ncbi:DUF411 domain-containing protein [Tabrizicola sp. YIM 78059]|uniref:DUF411 domain-containing protein n=1 Tax=Tabrizicola sp. YIM 78059 TaxID=2529861 RepID=UPI0010AACD3A|nr:DUF411 domain-containing protein [Tabrizicola sp. YIM 78059]
MSSHNLCRRKVLKGATALLAMSPLAAAAEGAAHTIHVVKDPDCGCCNSWIGHLRDNGFTVSFEERGPVALSAFKRERGIPDELASCHTAIIGDYTIEGHVPAADIRRLLAERPDALGLAVPGMPYGSPGMGPESAREAYDVLLIRRNGTAEVFAHYPAAG